jgi:hypothetical protein
VTGGANFLAVDLESCLTAANRSPEIDSGLVFEISSLLRSAWLLRMLRACKDPGENVLEAAPAGPGLLGPATEATASALTSRKIEAVKIHLAAAPAAALLARICLGLRRVNLV